MDITRGQVVAGTGAVALALLGIETALAGRVAGVPNLPTGTIIVLALIASIGVLYGIIERLSGAIQRMRRDLPTGKKSCGSRNAHTDECDHGRA